MKKRIVLIVCIFIFSLFILNARVSPKSTLDQTPFAQPSLEVSVTPAPSKTSRLLFVPYWSFAKGQIQEEDIDTLIYFGIAPNMQGIDKGEAGYKALPKFIQASDKNINKLLAVRMLNEKVTFPVLKDTTQQKKIAKESIAVAKENGFSGIVLDLELISLPFASITQQITDFVEVFSREAKKEKLSFSLLLYGDTFYRIRPFDVIAVSQSTDMILVMAYDFHKANGDPGPNFPLLGKEIYGYDLSVMTSDYLNFIPKEKLGIVSGMFGYDWIINEHGKGVGQAKAITIHEAEQLFYPCYLRNCIVTEDKKSSAIKATYIDAQGSQHVVWFDNRESVKEKEAYLKEKGINSFGYWAYSYY